MGIKAVHVINRHYPGVAALKPYCIGLRLEFDNDRYTEVQLDVGEDPMVTAQSLHRLAREIEAQIHHDHIK